MTWQEQLTQWRFDRNLTEPTDAYIFMMNEESEEAKAAESTYELIDALADLIVLTTNQAALEQSTLDFTQRQVVEPLPELLAQYQLGNDNSSIFQQIYAGCSLTIYQLGFALDKVMLETVKEISSRTGAMDESTGKWTKFTTPEAKALWYKADYSTCKEG